MPYISHSPEDIREMLSIIGVGEPSELFAQVPKHLRNNIKVDIPQRKPPFEIERLLSSISDENRLPGSGMHFLGAGLYNHWIPPFVDEIVGRQEFYTAYTPYQPEVSQGTLTAIFEYQTMMSSLTGLPVSNASLYDGATALAEAVLLSLRATKRNTIALSRSVHPEYRRVVETYLKPLAVKVIEIPLSRSTSEVDKEALGSVLKTHGKDLASVVVASPNFFGIIEDISSIRKLLDDSGTLLIASVSEALSLALLKPPGEIGANIVSGEAASFGNYMNFGGPLLGFICVEEKLVRNLPGRLCGETIDKDGNRCFVFTLSTREQHIRREKATSNICTNQNLLAVRAAIYLAGMGEAGLRNLAMISASRARYASKGLSAIPGVSLRFVSPCFNEFVISVPDPELLLSKLTAEGIAGGLRLKRFYKEFDKEILMAFTELNRESDIDRFIASIEQNL